MLIAYPNIVYAQATEPNDKTAGRIWLDTDNQAVYIADGTNYSALGKDTPYVAEIYTGTGFNNSTGGTTAEVELTEVTDTKGADYVDIKSLVKAQHDWSNTTEMAKLIISIKEIGGTYMTIFNGAPIVAETNDSNAHVTKSTIDYLYALTDGMKQNGFQIKLGGYIYQSGSSIANIQTVITLI